MKPKLFLTQDSRLAVLYAQRMLIALELVGNIFAESRSTGVFLLINSVGMLDCLLAFAT